jgi:phospholipase C
VRRDIGDRWFSSVPGATWPNRLYTLAGKSEGSPDDNKTPPGPIYNQASVVRFLEANRVTWRWYSHDPPTLRMVDRRYRFDYQEHFAYFDRRAVSELTRDLEHPFVAENSFLDDVAEERLPQVAWIDPNFIDLSVWESGSNDDHPPSDVHDGQRLVLAVYDALAGSERYWDKTLLIVTYDEHGGFYDHVTPEACEDDDPRFRTYGLRVPALLVSPLVEPGRVNHATYDHTSIVKTLLQRFCRDANGTIPDMGARVNAALDLGGALTRTTPRPAPEREAVREEVLKWRTAAVQQRSTDLLGARTRKGSEERTLSEFQAGFVHAVRRLREKGRLLSGRP